MKAERTFVLVLGAVALFLFAAPALAGIDPEECDAVIEVNALRGGSPTVSVGVVKNITAKARLAKGEGPADQTLNDTTLTIEAFDGEVLVDSQTSGSTVTLVVGKGGQGDKLGLTADQCNSGSIDYVATFSGTSSTNGSTCTVVSRKLNKTCN